MGHSGEGFISGIAVFNYNVGAIFVIIFVSLFFLPFYIKSGIYTIPEYLGRRFDNRSRKYFSFITIIGNVFLDAGAALYTGALILKIIFPEIDMMWIIIGMALMAGTYTIIGGLSSAINADMIQSIILIAGSVLLSIFCFNSVGGWENFVEHFHDGVWLNLIRPNWKQAVPVDMPKYTIELDDSRYAVQVAELVEYLVKEKGMTCIKQFNLGNEVNLVANDPRSGYSWEKWKKAILNLRSELDKRGLNDIEIVGPDGGYWGTDVWFNKTLTELDSVVPVIDYHWYINKDWTFTNRVEDETRMFRFFTQMQDSSKVNIWGEMGIRDGHNEVFDQHTLIHQWWYGTFVADALIQTLRSGWSAAAAWGMDDAMHYKDDLDEQKRWGFWNSLAEQKNKPEEVNIRPWFYTWSLMSRNIPKGSKILYSNSYRTQNLNGVAALTPTGDLTFAITNTADFAQRVTVQIPTVVNDPIINKYVYFEDDYPVDTAGFPVVKKVLKDVDLQKGIVIDFPAKGFVLLTTIGGSKPEIVKNDKYMMDPMEGVQRMYDHSDNLGLNGFPKFYDECNTAAPDFQFFKVLEDCGTIHPSTDEEHAYITYKFDGFNYFEIKVSGVETITDRFKVYVSPDNCEWREVELSFTEPEMSVWRFVHSTITPKTELDNCNYLKIEMLPNGYFSNTRIRKVKIEKR